MNRATASSGSRWIAVAVASLAAAARLFALQTTIGVLSGIGFTMVALIALWRAADLMIWSEGIAAVAPDRREPEPPAFGD